MKKLKLILSIILISLMILKSLSSCSFAITTEQLNNYLDNWNILQDTGEFSHGGGVKNLYRIRQLFPQKWDEFFNEYQGGAWHFCEVIRVNYESDSNFNFTVAKGINTTQIKYNSTNGNITVPQVNYYRWTYTNSTHTFTRDVTIQNYNLVQPKGLFLIFNQNWDSEMKAAFTEDPTQFNTEYQWTYINTNGGQYTLYTNGNPNINAFRVRIGQYWDITNVTFNLYYKENETIKYIDNVNMIFDRIGETNEFFVKLVSDNLFNDETYYLEMIYRRCNI